MIPDCKVAYDNSLPYVAKVRLGRDVDESSDVGYIMGTLRYGMDTQSIFVKVCFFVSISLYWQKSLNVYYCFHLFHRNL